MDTPPLWLEAGEFEQAIMVQYRTEYMVDGTGRLPSKVIEIQRASRGRFANERPIFQLPIFQLRNKAQKKHLNFVPGSIVKVAGALSRVEMNAKERRP